jgi:putative inorganic carbon (HCO3(-)) transporter
MRQRSVEDGLGNYASPVLALAVVHGPVPKLGVVAVAAAAAGAMLLGDPRRRALAMLAALVLAPVLLLAEIWNSPQLHFVHHHPLQAAVAALLALALLAAVAAAIARRPWLTAVLAMLALPFRIPISSAGTTSNLLVPLYLVVAAGALAFVGPALVGSWRRGAGAAAADYESARTGRFAFEWLLGAYIVVYAIQATYSVDFQKGLENEVFFYVPFALLLVLLRDLAWDRQLLLRCLGVIVGLAAIFAVIGYGEYATRHLLLNPKLVQANALHTYFTVNSVFFDPNIFGRFLALVMVLLATVLVYERRRNRQLASTVLLAMLWTGLLLTISRSSIGALLVGLAVLAVLRWRLWPVLAAGACVVVVGAVALALSPRTFGLNQGFNGASSGRGNLVTGGLDMFGERPVWGYGAGSFVTEYRRQHPHQALGVSASHTIPITIAAEQGLIGLVLYAALVIAALVTLLRRVRGDPMRVALAAAFIALVFHTMLYADFLEDPISWTLLGIGAALALASSRGGARGAADRAPAFLAA